MRGYVSEFNMNIRQLYLDGLRAIDIARKLKMDRRQVEAVLRRVNVKPPFHSPKYCKNCNQLITDKNKCKWNQSWCDTCFRNKENIRISAYIVARYKKDKEFRKRFLGYNKNWREKRKKVTI